MTDIKKKEPRISPKDFADVTGAIFTKGNDFTGVSIAAHMGLRQYQLWTDVTSRGLTAGEARMFSDALDQWAIRLMTMARKMRSLATELEGGTLPPMKTLAEARRAARAYVPIPRKRSLPAEGETDEPARAGADAEPLDLGEDSAPVGADDLGVFEPDDPGKRTRFV